MVNTGDIQFYFIFSTVQSSKKYYVSFTQEDQTSSENSLGAPGLQVWRCHQIPNLQAALLHSLQQLTVALCREEASLQVSNSLPPALQTPMRCQHCLVSVHSAITSKLPPPADSVSSCLHIAHTCFQPGTLTTSPLPLSHQEILLCMNPNHVLAERLQWRSQLEIRDDSRHQLPSTYQLLTPHCILLLFSPSLPPCVYLVFFLSTLPSFFPFSFNKR